MAELAHYPKYKFSGSDSFGEIPAHWQVLPIKFSLEMPITDGPHSTPIFYSDGIPFISAEAVKNDRLDFDKKRGYISQEDHELFSKKYKPKFGDVYMVKSGATTGAVARVHTHDEFNIWSPLAVLRPHPEKAITDFIFYILKSKPFFYEVEQCWSYGTQQNIGMGVISNIRMALPPLEEQQAIARFLDFKTVQIDALIAKKKSLLDKLAEKRTALISHAVTKGLDPTVAMKDSGVIWVGRIPSHWTIRRLKDVGSLIGGAGFPHDLQNVQDEELYFYKVGDLSLSENGKTLLSSPHTISRETAKALRASVIPKESIVYAKIGAALLLNRRRMTTSDCCIDNNMTAYVVKQDRVSPDWAFYWLTTIDFAEHVNPGAVPSFSEGYQSILSIPLPPIDEQQSIVSFLEEHTTQIDVQVKKIEAVIERLLEYRSAIITNAVTGKIDVRDVPIGQPTEA